MCDYSSSIRGEGRTAVHLEVVNRLQKIQNIHGVVDILKDVLKGLVGHGHLIQCLQVDG